MIDMDRQKAFAVLGLPDDASREEIDVLVGERRRRLRQRIVFASTAEQRESSERALAELESAHAVATLLPEEHDNNFPQGAKLAFAAGTTLADRYVIRRRIGYGENGAVFAALDLSWGNEVALKIIRPELLLVPGTQDRLNAAVRSVYGLAHSGIARVYGVSKIDGHVAIPTELLTQQNLRSLVSDVSPIQSGARPSGLPVGRVVDIVQRVSGALDYARTQTLHLNLKPDNVILTDDGRIKLTDFRLDVVLQPTLTITSPTAREQRRYRAPELARQSETGVSGGAAIDQRADQFSLAAIAHFLLLSVAPYPDPSDVALQHMGVSAPIANVLAKALSSDPSARYPTVRDFSEALKRASRVGMTKRVFTTLMGAVGFAAILIATTSLVLEPTSQTRNAIATLLSLDSYTSDHDRLTSDTRILQSRVLELSRFLTESQNDLRRALIERRIDVRSKAMALDMAETNGQRAEAEEDLAAANASYTQTLAIRDLANPEIFNSPETLNAMNMIGLANDHLVAGRASAAQSALQRAEAVLKSKLADYQQAIALADGSLEVGASHDGQDATLTGAKQLRRVWQQASQQRKRFALGLQAKMVTIPGGSFQMGDKEGIGNQTEQPIRQVLVPVFQMSAFEVTTEEYQACVSDGGCEPLAGPQGATQQTSTPAVGASWFDAQDYAAWVSRKSGQDYRLPTEAEWEYAARANVGSAYPWGEEPGLGLANCVHCGSAWEGVGPAPVGSFAPNAFGLYDMSGNVWEWTADCWYPTYKGAPGIAIARESNALCTERVLRGGSWDNDAWLARTTYRGRGHANMRHDLNGFRLAKSIN